MMYLRSRHITHTPYEPERSCFLTFDSLIGSEKRTPTGATTTDITDAEAHALHASALSGRCSFVPYPQTVPEAAMVLEAAYIATQQRMQMSAETSMRPQTPAEDDDDDDATSEDHNTTATTTTRNQGGPRTVALVRAFVGQLPFHVTGQQLEWLCALFGCTFTDPQRIMKSNGRGARLPTGGVHVSCDVATLARLQQCMHKRVLIDDTGVWFAATLREKRALEAHTAFLHAHRDMRHAGRPYESVVVQAAQSSFVSLQFATFDV